MNMCLVSMIGIDSHIKSEAQYRFFLKNEYRYVGLAVFYGISCLFCSKFHWDFIFFVWVFDFRWIDLIGNNFIFVKSNGVIVCIMGISITKIRLFLFVFRFDWKRIFIFAINAMNNRRFCTGLDIVVLTCDGFAEIILDKIQISAQGTEYWLIFLYHKKNH